MKYSAACVSVENGFKNYTKQFMNKLFGVKYKVRS